MKIPFLTILNIGRVTNNNMSLFTHLIAFLLFTTLFYASYSVKFSNVNAPLLLQGRNVRLPTESVSDVYISVAERKNALKSTQNIIDKMKGQNPFEKSGFITVNPDYESKMYYLFYESKSTSTPTTPIILWLQGMLNFQSVKCNGTFYIHFIFAFILARNT